jgi:hypothetical protein
MDDPSNGEVLPEARQIGESEVDHLDLVLFDYVKDILGDLATERHGSLSSGRHAARPLPGAPPCPRSSLCEAPIQLRQAAIGACAVLL